MALEERLGVEDAGPSGDFHSTSSLKHAEENKELKKVHKTQVEIVQWLCEHVLIPEAPRSQVQSLYHPKPELRSAPVRKK